MNTITLLTKTLSALCDGQCGGEIDLTTDEVRNAYAVVEVSSGRFIGQDCDAILRHADGTITVSCAAVDPDAEQRCDGSVTFTKDMLNEAAWGAPTPEAVHMAPMERA